VQLVALLRASRTRWAQRRVVLMKPYIILLRWHKPALANRIP